MFNKIITKEEIKFNELEKKIFKFVCFLGCMLIKLVLESYDQKLMKNRDKAKYRHKGKRKNTIKTVMGEVEYERAMYLVKEEEKIKYVFLLDEVMKISGIGKISQNLAETVMEVAVNTPSYRKAEANIEAMTNCSISHEGIRNKVIEIGNKIGKREKEEVLYMKKNQLVKGLKEIAALFEEADGIWINLQGKDRNKRLEEQKKKCKKEGKSFNPKAKVKTELKLHVMYEGWKKEDKRHSLVNKVYIAGIMKPKEIRELRDARIYQKYDEEKIQLRVVNGDGAAWTKGITPKGGIYQKDYFHIRQEIVRDVPKEYRNVIEELVENKEYYKIPKAIQQLKYGVDGEEKKVEKLKRLESYLSSGLERYKDILVKQGKEIPVAPEGIEYRNMGTQESQIFSILKVRFCSGRKAFSEQGSNALAKVCVAVKDNEFKFEDIETSVSIDTSVENWIKEIENKIIKKNRNVGISNNFRDISNCKTSSLTNAPKFLKEIAKEIDFLSMKCSF